MLAMKVKASLFAVSTLTSAMLVASTVPANAVSSSSPAVQQS